MGALVDFQSFGYLSRDNAAVKNIREALNLLGLNRYHHFNFIQGVLQTVLNYFDYDLIRALDLRQILGIVN